MKPCYCCHIVVGIALLAMACQRPHRAEVPVEAATSTEVYESVPPIVPPAPPHAAAVDSQRPAASPPPVMTTEEEGYLDGEALSEEDHLGKHAGMHVGMDDDEDAYEDGYDDGYEE